MPFEDSGGPQHRPLRGHDTPDPMDIDGSASDLQHVSAQATERYVDAGSCIQNQEPSSSSNLEDTNAGKEQRSLSAPWEGYHEVNVSPASGEYRPHEKDVSYDLTSSKRDEGAIHGSGKDTDISNKPKTGTRQSIFSFFSGSDKREPKASEDAYRTETRVAISRAKLQNFEEAYARLERANGDLKRKLQGARAKNDQLFEQWTEGKVGGRWNPLPDDEVRQLLKNLDNDITDWAAKWAVKGLDLGRGPDEFVIEFAAYLSPFVRLTQNGSLPTVICGPPARMREKIPVLLLNGGLWDTIHTKFFKTPFWCFPNHSEALHDIFSQLAKGDPREAQAWRCSLWRLLSPARTSDMTRSQQEVYEDTKNKISDFCDTVASHFESGPACFLLKAESEDHQRDHRAKQLREILRDAAAIAERLWTQNSSLETVDLKYIQERNLTFDVSSPLLQGHRQSRLAGIDDDDEVNNGRKILIVTRPGLVRVEQNEGNGSGRTLAKAIVWLDDLPQGQGARR
ncbi:uncharacterized protein Z518_01480 [Rhinocladiella mackenziei CBS 650.93]|uniref:Uncharacterized protein n=1 Tax=Rhinocladiella mackenziei CBS 650.93 TaxID=1442369 RepID=A0A0D2HI90_9EURO|nr:uncharacterized protein Z518_01480 [Rhinocladiella mackenziei CBS 650.93]KIX10398.1 hypothetical protein Z518_01480 [Rhinocladiella mackenziei CBS 650.93]